MSKTNGRLNLVKQLKVRVTVFNVMICLNVAVYRSTREGKRKPIISSC